MSKTGADAPYRGEPRIRFLHSWKHRPPSPRLRRTAFIRLASRSRAAAKAGGASRDRTDDLKLAKLALSQLSYGPAFALLRFGGQARSARDGLPSEAPQERRMVGREGVEPSTSRLSGVRSNHLSYRPP